MNKELEQLKFNLAAETADLLKTLEEPTAEEVTLVLWTLLTTWEEACAKPRKRNRKGK